MGSGSFLVAALRYLTDALYESLHYHQRIAKHGDNSLCRLAEGEGSNSLLVETLPVLPDSEQFEERLKGRLKRYIVERCIYGVDIDPLAVELGRLALWVETMDKTLPFSFVDHKLKCGNALVGCWFDRFQDYPAMAWERKGGDESHSKFVHHFREYVATRGKNKGKSQQKGDKWSQAIKEIKGNIVKEELKNLLKSLDPTESFLDYPDFNLPKVPEAIHDEALEIFERLHNLPVFDTENREKTYREEFKRSEAIKRLKFAFDTWCAVWFWNGDLLAFAPTPNKFFNPPEETREIIEQLAQDYQFFHWELEFPDVFNNVCPHPLTPSPNDERKGTNVENTPPEKETEDKKNSEGSSGFSAIIGNPPWEIQKPNSMEFFSNIDPLYRTYGKQDALQKQVDYFTDDPNIEKAWLSYCDRLKALSNWTKNVGYPWGDPTEAKDKFSLSRSGKETEFLHELWRNRRSQQKGYADPRHPFILQGSADINTYKMFLELSLSLLGNKGRMGLIVPSGIYTDKGSTNLRTEFLEFNQWEWLFGFENRDKIFDIHRSFKFCPVIIIKGGQTSAIKATFMQHSLNSWENAEDYILDYPRQRVEQFSPNSKAILEIRNQRDLQVLEKMYENSVLLGDNSPQGWGIQYATEFHMTNDSKLFPPRPQWEKKGYIADEYGHWLKGNWQEIDPPQPLETGENEENSLLEKGENSSEVPLIKGDLGGSQESILNRPAGVILSADKTKFIHVDDVEDVALPLYEGRMIGQFDFSQKGWVSGKGRTAVWRDIPFENKVIEPQYLMSLSNFKQFQTSSRIKTGFMDVASATNSRTMIATLLDNYPCGNKVPTLSLEENQDLLNANLELCVIFNSFVYDYSLRNRLGGLTLNYFIIEETNLLKKSIINGQIKLITASLLIPSVNFSQRWLDLALQISNLNNKSWYKLWAITPYERLRLRCILDAVIAELYGLEIEDFEWILRDCVHPIETMKDKQFYRTLDPKGFWRVDKEKDPELRHTVLSLVAFHDLKSMGLEAFLNLNEGEGWMIPHHLTLADYGLGHDDRAKHPQPVAERFLPSPPSVETFHETSLPTHLETLETYNHLRYYPWQLEANIEESWLECERHAENLKKLLGDPLKGGENETNTSLEKGEKTKENQFENLEDKTLPSDPNYQPPTDLLGNPLQVDLFGNIVDDKPKKRRK